MSASSLKLNTVVKKMVYKVESHFAEIDQHAEDGNEPLIHRVLTKDTKHSVAFS